MTTFDKLCIISYYKIILHIDFLTIFNIDIKKLQEGDIIKEYRVVLNDDVSEFYENLSRFLNRPIEEILTENLVKNMDLLTSVLLSPSSARGPRGQRK